MESKDDPPRTFRTTISIGIAVATSFESYDVEKLLAGADANLYHAKESGRNRTVASELVSR